MILSILFLLIFLSAIGYFTYRITILYRLARATTGPVWSGSRLDRIPERISTFFIYVLGQRAVLRKKSAGIMHAAIFWGFLVITIETVELFIYELRHGFTWEFIGPTLYSALVGIQDFFVLAVLGGVLFALYRRLVLRPEGLGKTRDSIIILLVIATLMISLIFMHAFEMIAEPRWFDRYRFFSSMVSHWLEPMAIQPEKAAIWAAVFRWIHHLAVLGFLVYIPSSKHLHLFTAAPNTFLRKLETAKGMRKINLEDENATSFGAAKITDLSWKDTLDTYACTECGRCQDACPAHNTQKPLSPKALIHDLKDSLYSNKTAILARKLDEVGPIIGEKITDDVIWSCTSCRACEASCPVFIEHTDKIYEVRRNLVLMESRFPAEVQPVFKSMEDNASPWAMSPDDRDKWAAGLDVKSMAEVAAGGEQIDYLFWVGCAGSYDERAIKVSKALVSILKKADIKFAILGKEEKCTGDPARRMGNEYLAQTLIQQNVATLNGYNVKKIITACPHCFNSIKNEWPDFGGKYEVMHHTQLISRLIRTGKLKPSKGSKQRVTYHDSCYLGRWNNEYSSARAVLRSLPMVRIQEMKKHGSDGMCCGAGGGRMWMEETIGSRINVTRTTEALETNASVIAANCPFCITMLNDGLKAKSADEKVKVLDIAELVDQATI